MWIDITVLEPELNKEVLIRVEQGLFKFFLCAHLEINNSEPEYRRKYWKQFGNYPLFDKRTIPFHHVSYWHEIPNIEQLKIENK